MATPVTFDGSVYSIPAFGDTGYAQGPGNLSSYLIALASGTFQQTGGVFTLTADANFGPNFGLMSKYFKSITTLPATAGAIRLSKTDTIDWRNNANSANLALGIDGADNLTFNGSAIGFTGAVNPGLANQLAYYATSSNTVSGLTLITPNKALESDANGLPVASSVTSTTLAFLDATSSVQTQLNATAPSANPTFTGTVTVPNGVNPTDAAAFGQIASATAAFLPLAGGTMSGVIDMGSHKITNLTQGTTTGDAIAFPVAAAQIASATITGTQIVSSVALAGSPTTTTQGTNDSSTKIATTAFVNPGSSLGGSNFTPGFMRFPNGLVMQWGPIPLTNGSGTQVTITYPTGFTNIFNLQVTAQSVGGNGISAWKVVTGSVTAGQFTLQNNDATTAFTGYWVALGV